MNRLVFLTLMILALAGCRIDFSVDGEGRVTSDSGNFDCDETGAPDCTETYALGTTEIFTADPAAGFTFAKWTSCTYLDLFRCSVTFNDSAAATPYAIPMKASFKAINPPIQSTTYTYNALGQRITKTVGPKTTIFQYDLSGNLIAELNATGQPLREHIHVNSEPIAQLTVNPASQAVTVAYVHPDHLGTPTLLTNAQDQVVVDIEATPFGETYVDYTAVEYTRRFPGQYSDEETGLRYNYFRDYDPSLGRYIQSDPRGILLDYSDPLREMARRSGIATSRSFGTELNNSYGYVNQNPMVRADQTGEVGPAAAAACVIPGVGVGCAFAAAGVATAGAFCYLTGACQEFAQACYDAFRSGNDFDDEEGCDEERAACSELCAEAYADPDRRHVVGGSINQCIRNCLPERCGGEGTWKGF